MIEMKGATLLGGALVLISLAFLGFNTIRTEFLLLQIMGAVNLVIPILTGRKMAYYIHDFKLAKERGYRASPMALVYIWLIFWLLFLLFYSAASLALSYTFKFLILQWGGTTTAILFSILLLLGSYLLFSGISSGKGFVSSWGKRVERMNSGVGRAKEKIMGEIEKYL